MPVKLRPPWEEREEFICAKQPGKQRFLTREEAQKLKPHAEIKTNRMLDIYHCKACDGFHYTKAKDEKWRGI